MTFWWKHKGRTQVKGTIHNLPNHSFRDLIQFDEGCIATVLRSWDFNFFQKHCSFHHTSVSMIKHQNLPENLLKQISGLYSQFLIHLVWSGTQKFSYQTSSRVMLMLLVHGSHFENSLVTIPFGD